MTDIENPYLDKSSETHPPPGVRAEVMASALEIGLRLVGISLYPHEHRGLAAVMDAVLRAYPALGEKQ